MGGTLWLGNAHADGNEDFFSYRYSGFHTMKGHILRASIQYLKSVKENATKEPKKTVRQLLLDADIKVVTDCSSDDDALSKGTAAINDATAVLQGWVRNPSGGVSGRDAMLQMLMNRNAGGGGFGFGGGFDALRMPLNIDNELNSTYHITKLDELFQCPIALEKVGMRGMYHLMKLADNNVLIYPEEAQMMASALERAISVMPEGDGGDEDDYNEDSALKEMSNEFKDLLVKCIGDRVIKG